MQQGQRAQGSISDSARGNAIAISQRRSTSGQRRTFGDSTPARPISQHIPQLAQCAHRRRQRPLDSETQRTEDATSCRSLSGEGGCEIVWVRCLVATTSQVTLQDQVGSQEQQQWRRHGGGNNSRLAGRQQSWCNPSGFWSGGGGGSNAAIDDNSSGAHSSKRRNHEPR